MSKIPIYQETDKSTLKPGLYLCLFNGRKTADEELDDWGANGPMIGPLRFVHTTFEFNVKFDFVDVEDAVAYGLPSECFWNTEEGMLRYPEATGLLYGDWTVMNVRARELAPVWFELADESQHTIRQSQSIQPLFELMISRNNEGDEIAMWSGHEGQGAKKLAKVEHVILGQPWTASLQWLDTTEPIVTQPT